jgi:SAM-dependent methyltransferase
MTRDDVSALLTPQAMHLLDEFADLDTIADSVGAVTALRKAGADARTSAVVLTQLKLRRRARAKFGEFAKNLLFTEAGLAQATRLQVAARHAERFRRAEARRVADLGCGIGADSLAFASLGFDLVAVDADEVTAALATFNLAPFSNARVEHGVAEDFDLAEFDGVFLDPARRTELRGTTRRLADPNDWRPSLDFAFGTATETRTTGVKLGPAMPHELLPEATAARPAEAQWLSVDGELVECAVWLGASARSGVARSALVLRDGAARELVSSTLASEDAPIDELGEYLYEPDGAVIRGRFIGDLARELGGHMISREIAWVTADAAHETPFAQSFRVREVLPLHPNQLKKRLRALEIGRLEIKKRGVDIDPAKLRKELQPRGDEAATLICTRVQDRRVAILADRC